MFFIENAPSIMSVCTPLNINLVLLGIDFDPSQQTPRCGAAVTFPAIYPEAKSENFYKSYKDLAIRSGYFPAFFCCNCDLTCSRFKVELKQPM